MSLVFQPLPNALLALAKLPHGRIIDDDDNTYTIMHEGEAEAALVALSEAGCDEDMVELMRTELIALNFPADLGELILALTQVNLGDDFDPGDLSFEICEPDEDFKVPHGQIIQDDHLAGASAITSMEHALSIMMVGARDGFITAEQGIFLLKQMAAADLMLTQKQVLAHHGYTRDTDGTYRSEARDGSTKVETATRILHMGPLTILVSRIETTEIDGEDEPRDTVEDDEGGDSPTEGGGW